MTHFFFVKQSNICSFADDSTPCTSGNNELVVVKKTLPDCNRISNIIEYHYCNRIMFLGKMIDLINFFMIDNVEVKPKEPNFFEDRN